MTQAQSTQTLSRWYLSKVMAISAVYAGSIAIFSKMISDFSKIFNDMKVTVPPFTGVMIKVGSLIWISYGWVLIVPSVLAMPGMVVRRFPARCDTITYVLLVFLFVTVAAFIAAILLPILFGGSGGISGPSN